jgi:hypothetical protein
MTQRALIIAVLVLGVASAAACTTVHFGKNTYQPCEDSVDCVMVVDQCLRVTHDNATLAICTAPCAGDSECPGDGRCLAFGEIGRAFCFDGCEVDGDCPTGWSCHDTTGGGALVCIPGAAAPSIETGLPPYEACTTAGCSSASEGCATVDVEGSTAGMCTSACTIDPETMESDCPLDARGVPGRCLSLDAGVTTRCWEACLDDQDCPTDWSCLTSIGALTVDPICVPIPPPPEPEPES